MIERPDADELLKGPLGSWLLDQNEERARVKAKADRIWQLGLAAACAVAVLLILFGGYVGTAMKFGFAIGFGGFALSEFIKRPMISKLKGGINGAIAEALGLHYAVQANPGEPFIWAKQFEMLPGYSKENFEDHWWGELGPRPFAVHEAKLTEERGSGKDRRTETVFEGTIMAIGFSRRFTGTTLIEADGERRKFLIGPEKERATIGGIEMQRIDLVNPVFEERFTVWSNDLIEGQYLVHPSYVERLLAVEKAFSGKKIRALFHEGTLVIVLETGDMFESGSLDAGEDRALLVRTIEQFGSLADLAANLNERERMTFADLRPS